MYALAIKMRVRNQSPVIAGEMLRLAKRQRNGYRQFRLGGPFLTNTLGVESESER